MDKSTMIASIAAEIRKYIAATGMSQNKTAEKFGISAAAMSNIMNGIEENLAEKTLRELAAKLNIRPNTWEILKTPQMQTIHNVCNEAKEFSRFLAIVSETGQGKTTALTVYERQNPNTYYVLCDVLMTQASFLKSIAKSMGIVQQGSKADLLERITSKLKSQEKPLLILDDCGKVADRIYQMLQLIYDQCKGSVGIIIAGVPYMQKYIKGKKERDSFCFPELFRRIAYWKKINGIDGNTIAEIAIMHGINDPDCIKFLKKYVENIGNLEEWITNAKRNAKDNPITLEILTRASNINA